MRTGHTQALFAVPAAARHMPPAWKPRQGAPTGGFAASILDDLQGVLNTRTADVMLFPGGAASAWEAAVAATLSPGDRVLVVRSGQAATDWARMAARMGLEVEAIDRPWGAPVPVAEMSRRLGADRFGTIKAVFVALAGAAPCDMAGVRRALDTAFHDALLFVEGSAAPGPAEIHMDAWCVDAGVTVTGAGPACAAGLGVLGLSAQALAAKPAAVRPVAVGPAAASVE